MIAEAHRHDPNDPVAPLGRFLELRESLRRAPIGDGGRDTCRALSIALDDAIADLFPPVLAGELAAVAVGGYGRREQSLYSDVDLMLLHSGSDIGDATRLLLYPLWDSGLKVGHSVRTVGEAVAAAREDVTTLTSLLTMRRIAGSDRLVNELEAALVPVLRGRPLARQLIAAERERRANQPYPLMAADLKNGRGSLRTLHSFIWERRRAILIGAPPPHARTEDEKLAHRSLLAVRNALHATAGKPIDAFHPDLREGAARWLGMDLWDVSERVTHSNRACDRLAMERWPDLAADVSAIGVAGRLRNRFRRRPAAHDPQRPLARAMAAADRPEGVSLDGAARAAIASAGTQEWTAEDRDAFVAMLERGPRGRVAFGWLDNLGWIDANLPEIRHTIAAPQLAPFHEHPVDSHLWRTVDEMRGLMASGSTEYGRIASEVADRRLLLLAAFLHDVGKALPGDHSTVGAEIAAALCTRIGFVELAEPVSKLVRHHLLLATTATKRDTADPKVLTEVAELCGDLTTLSALYLLTVADSRATGKAIWSHWRATLLRNLYGRLAAQLDPKTFSPRRAERVAIIADLAATVPEEVADHLDAMPPSYLDSHSDDEVAAHVRLAGGATARPQVALLDPDEPAPRLVVAAADTTGVLGAIAGVLAMHNLEVLDARLQTRDDGVACDTFHVCRTLRDVHLPEPGRLASDLAAALDGTIDLTALVAAKTAPYLTPGSDALEVRAPVDPTLRYTAIEVRCADSPGVLYEIVQELYAAELDVRMARIDTRADEVRDLFYVLRDGEPIRDVNDVAPLVTALRQRLRQRLRKRRPVR